MITVRPFDAPLGAAVTGVDLREPLDDATFAEIARAWAEYSVLVFPSQKLTPEQHIAFSRRFGELEELSFYQQYLHRNHPEIFVVSNVIENGKHIGLPDAGRIWHTDVSYKKEPSMGSLLYAREIPSEDGKPLGDTIFVSTAAAYEALPAEMRERLNGKTAIHSLSEARYKKDPRTDQQRGNRAALTEEQKKMIQAVEHPVVRTHPVTGRKCLYVNELYTFRVTGMPEEEGKALVAELCAHCVRPEFMYRHKWSVGDLLLWDNCATQHNAVGDYALPQRRLMHRTTIKCGVPF